MDKSQKPSVLALVKQAGMLRPQDLDQYGIPREYLSRLRTPLRLRRQVAFYDHGCKRRAYLVSVLSLSDKKNAHRQVHPKIGHSRALPF